jgi:hypothetical protein
MSAAPPIADRSEFIDVLKLMRKGRLLVRNNHDRCLVDGHEVRYSFETLQAYGLLDEVRPPPGEAMLAPHLHWYRLSPRGLEFADRAYAEWRARPLWQRLLVRLMS